MVLSHSAVEVIDYKYSSVSNFFDDILIATVDWDSHIQCLRQVRSKLQRFGWTARPIKGLCGFPRVAVPWSYGWKGYSET